MTSKNVWRAPVPEDAGLALSDRPPSASECPSVVSSTPCATFALILPGSCMLQDFETQYFSDEGADVSCKLDMTIGCSACCGSRAGAR